MEQRDLMDQRGQYVVKANDLVQKARYDLTATQQKFVCYLISKVKPGDGDMLTYEVTVEDFCAVTGIDKNHFYGEFKNLIDDFDNRNFWIETDKVSTKFYWFDYVEYVRGEGRIRVALTRRLSAYLLHLRENFTSYELYNILGLRSRYSIRLFELFKSYSYRPTIEFKTNDLKQVLYVDDHYPNFSDFRRFVLTPAVREISEFTELNVTWEEKRTGRKITSVRFHIEAKSTTEKMNCFNRVEHLLDGANLDQMSLFDRGAHNGND